MLAWGPASPIARYQAKNATATGFEASCVTGLGSVTLAAGDMTGKVRVWHWRRGDLKMVFNVAVHKARVRCLSNGGDILFTGSEDGDVAQLDVLEDFTCRTFFSAGDEVHSVLARKFNVLVGCRGGCVWELTRRKAEPEVLRKLMLGVNAPVDSLDADEPAPGKGRVLVAGGDRLAVWLDPPRKRAGSGEKEIPAPPPDAARDAPGVASALLMPGGLGDYLTAGGAGLGHGPGEHVRAWAAQVLLDVPGPLHTLVRSDSGEGSFFFMAPEKGANPDFVHTAPKKLDADNGAPQSMVAFELVLSLTEKSEAEVEAEEEAQAESATGSGEAAAAAAQQAAAAAGAGVVAADADADAVAEPTCSGDDVAEVGDSDAMAAAGSTGKMRASRSKRTSVSARYPNPTVASISRKREVERERDMA